MALIPSLIFAVILVFGSLRMIPGDPVDQIAGPYASEVEKIELRKQLNLDGPFSEQLWEYFCAILQGDLGRSLLTGDRATKMLWDRIPATLELALLAVFISLIVGLVLGMVSAFFSGQWPDHIALFFSLIGVSMPNFWLGPLLVIVFSVYLSWLPVSERGGLLSYILPSLTLGLSLCAILARVTRSSVLDEKRKLYATVARAKGCGEGRVFGKHILKNAAIPITTILGLQLGALLTGSIITEKIFDWPGIGLLLIESIQGRDYPVVQACVLFFAIIYNLTNFLVDLTYMWLNPRARIT